MTISPRPVPADLLRQLDTCVAGEDWLGVKLVNDYLQEWRDKCPRCGGVGHEEWLGHDQGVMAFQYRQCPECGGTGRVG